MKLFFIFTFSILVLSGIVMNVQGTSHNLRPGYIYDTAGIISNKYESIIDSKIRQIDLATSAEIVIYTISSFNGHGIKKDDTEINQMDFLANYIFNEYPLDGINGIGKKDKNNGLLILLSLEPDVSGSSMRIEVG